MKQALQRLNETVQQSINFVKKFTDASFLGRFWNNAQHQEEFETLNAQLSCNIADLDLATNIAQIFDQKQDVADQREDLAEILSKLDEIALTMAKQQQESLDELKDMKDEFKRRFDSFKVHLRQDVLIAQSSVEAKKINDEAKLFLHIPGYDLTRQEQIGHGGFADVYRGKWISRHHSVAIKVIRITHLTDTVKQEFLNEITTMYKIRYEHTLGILGACMEPNYYALVVEYMSLGSLFDVLQKKDRSLSWTNRWSIALQMTKGVNYLHMMLILHRDIKSLNFLMEIAPDGYLVKVCDFGLAKIRLETSRQSASFTLYQTAPAGTLQWKAPELLKLGKPSRASDVYSLGVVFWEVATRCEPYEEVDAAIILQSVGAGNRLLIPDDVPSTFASIISNAWSQDPVKRPTCQELIERIQMTHLPTTQETAVQ